MDVKYLLITFNNGKEKLSMGTGEPIKVVTISGFEAPEYINNTSSIATSDGSLLTGQKVGERFLSVVFAIDDLENTDLYRKKIQKFFNPKRKISVQLNWCYNQAKIESIVESFEWTTITSMWDFLEGNLELRCPSPYWKDLDNFGKNIAAYTNQFTFPLSMNHFFQNKRVNRGVVAGFKTFKKEVVLNNKGDVPTGVEIAFYATRGPVKKPKITLLETGQFIEYMGDMEKGDVITINTNIGQKEVKKNGVNIFNEKNKLSTFFSLQVGNNTIKYSAEKNETNLDVRVYYTPEYLGV